MIGNTILLALREIRRNVLRSFLTILGIVIGSSASESSTVLSCSSPEAGSPGVPEVSEAWSASEISSVAGSVAAREEAKEMVAVIQEPTTGGLAVFSIAAAAATATETPRLETVITPESGSM